MYIHELKEWPAFIWNPRALSTQLETVRNRLTKLTSKLSALGFDEQEEAGLRVLTEDVVRTSEIEGQILDPAQVRSSIANKLGLPQAGVPKQDHNVDGIVAVVLDATQKCNEPLTEERLFGWHAALFPTGYSGLRKIIVGDWRDDSYGPMQVLSGRAGKETVHFEAPGYLRLPLEMERFCQWFERNGDLDPIVKAGIAHFYFVTIHPFDDGNGRIARAIADLALARADQMTQRYYSMSAQIVVDRNAYYDTLETSQSATLDITNWLRWFLDCLTRAIDGAEITLEDIMQKAKVWDSLKDKEINERQRKILNKLLDKTFFGDLDSKKYVKITHCSPDTANRDLIKLVDYGVLERKGKGKATKYILQTTTHSDDGNRI